MITIAAARPRRQVAGRIQDGKIQYRETFVDGPGLRRKGTGTFFGLYTCTMTEGESAEK